MAIIQIKLQTGDAASALKKVSNREVDIAVAALPDTLPKNLTFKPITKTPLVFIAPKVSWEFTHLLTEKIPWHRIPMILSEHGLARKRIDTWFRKKGIQPNIYARVSGNEAILSMVNLGCGVGVVPHLVVKKVPLKKMSPF